jgi:hypothetical protein
LTEWATVYVGLGLIVAQFVEVVPQLVESCIDVSLGIVRTAECQVEHSSAVALAVPASQLRLHLLSFVGSELEILEASQDLNGGGGTLVTSSLRSSVESGNWVCPRMGVEDEGLANPRYLMLDILSL